MNESHTRNTLMLLMLAVLLLAMSLPVALLADVSVRLDRDSVYTGDSVTLRITATGKDQDEQPDLAPLQKDFEILGTSTSQQIQIINGKRSDRREWLVELAPLQQGELEIPALNIGKQTTAALKLQVKEQPAAAAGVAGQPAFIRAEVSPSDGEHYVQQQLLYTTRLYYRVPLVEGTISDPSVKDAVVERLGEDRQYKTRIDDQGYQVLERRYAIFPEHSGPLTIGPARFNGRTVAATSQRTGFSRMDSMMQRMLSQSGFDDSFFAGTPFGNPGKRIRLGSDSVTLDIKPRPAEYSGAHWLPGQSMEIHDSWSESPPTLHAGEPVTRTLTIEARGLEASQLPSLQPTDTGDLRIYAAQPVLSNRTDGDWIYGRSEQTFTYVAARAGTLELPEIRVDWWNTTDNTMASTVLPAWQILVQPGSGANTAPPPPVTATAPASPPATPASTSIAAAATADDEESQAIEWQAVAGLAVLVIISALLVMRRTRAASPATAGSRRSGNSDAHDSNSLDTKRLRQALQNACSRGDAAAAGRALLDWAAHTWPDNPPRSLGALAGRVDRGAEAIRELERALYSSGDAEWVGQPLWKAWMDGFQATPAGSGDGNTTELPPLYPDWKEKPV